MLIKKIRLIIIACLLLISVITLSVLLYYGAQTLNIKSEIVISFISALIGGIFALVSVWFAQAFEKLRKDYDQLPKKLRLIDRLKSEILNLKSNVGQDNHSKVKEIMNNILEIAALIDGNSYARCIRIRDKSIAYCNNIRWEIDNEGNHLLVKDSEYINHKSEFYEMLEKEYEWLLIDEEKIIKLFK